MSAFAPQSFWWRDIYPWCLNKEWSGGEGDALGQKKSTLSDSFDVVKKPFKIYSKITLNFFFSVFRSFWCFLSTFFKNGIPHKPPSYGAKRQSMQEMTVWQWISRVSRWPVTIGVVISKMFRKTRWTIPAKKKNRFLITFEKLQPRHWRALFA